MTAQDMKNALAGAAGSLEGLLDKAARQVAVDCPDELFAAWRRVCSNCRQRANDDLLRMAVVGTIKSGKSTFINALCSGDYLKRGAGVITSIVTRVRRSDRLRAVLCFKSWNEINAEIRQSLGVLPGSGWRTSEQPFDIRKDSDRRDLETALSALESRHMLSRDTRSVSSVVLASYLKGYERVADIVSDRTETLVYEGSRFYAHQEFAGSQELAVFLKDLQIGIDSGDFLHNIEIADCQGSDSPNPLHLAMIQDYLHASDLIIYLISSRSGIRQADINFMSMIKQMGGMDNVLFVINCDFNEHENLADLQRVVEKIKEDLGLLVDSPRVYTFSSLYVLFAAMRRQLSPKDQARLAQWEQEKSLAGFSDKEKSRFEADFRQMLTEQRYSLLLKNQLQRLATTASDFHRWLELNRRMLSADADGAVALIRQIRQQQEKTEKIRAMADSSLAGACQQLKKEVKADVDRFFDIRQGEIVPGILDFIHGYTVAYDAYGEALVRNGFSETLFMVFQNFKDALDRYMAETVNPKLFRFAGQKEAEILERLESIIRPHERMIREALGDFQNDRAAGAAGDSEPDTDGGSEHVGISMDALKKANGIDMPQASATFDYTTRLKTEAFMKLGIYRFVQALRKLAKRGGNGTGADISALKSGVAKMRREIEAGIVFHFKNYRENVKFQYLFRLIDAVAGEMNRWLAERFQAYATDLSRIREMSNRNQADKQRAVARIEEIVSALEETEGRLSRMRADLEAGGLRAEAFVVRQRTGST